MVKIPVMDLYMESVAGYVQDEDKLVTYKWLSKELEIHVNLAKVVLARYWREHKDEVVATFLLIGYLKPEWNEVSGMRVEVVKDADLETAKKKFETITSQHIYSLQKTLTDINLLAGLDNGDAKFGSILCKQSIILTDEEFSKLRWGRASEIKSIIAAKQERKVIKNENIPTHSTKPEESKKTETKKNVDTKPAKKVSPPSKQAPEKKGTAAKKSAQSSLTGFANIFGKNAGQSKEQSKKDVPCEEKSSKAEDSPEKIQTPAEKHVEPESSEVEMEVDNKPINQKTEKKREKTPDVVENKQSKKKTELLKKASDSSPELSEKSQESSKKSVKSTVSKKAVAKKNNKNARGKKRDRSVSEDGTKKRKRIVIASDSSEDSAGASGEEDMFESPQLEEPPEVKRRSPTPPLIKQEGNKRKVRKLVDKTFVDEDGYLMTKKEHVYVSCSDEESETETKTSPDEEKPKETKQTAKKKQTTVTSFFFKKS